MPALHLLMLDWGNIVFLGEFPKDFQTVQCKGVRAHGHYTQIQKAIDDSNSLEQFSTICEERGLLAEPESMTA